MALQARHRWIISKIVDCFGIEDESYVERTLQQEKNLSQINQLFRAEGLDRIFVYYQAPTITDSAQQYVTPGSSESQSPSVERKTQELIVCNGETIPLTGTAIYFLRSSKEKVDLDPSVAGDGDISFGTLSASILGSIESYVTKVYKPLFETQDFVDWGKATKRDADLLTKEVDHFANSIQESLKSLTAGLELKKPNPQLMDASFRSNSPGDEIVKHFIDLLSAWCNEVEVYLEDDEQSKWENNEAGPNSELEYWRQRMQRLASITEQLKSKECRTVISVLNTGSKSHSSSEAERNRIFTLMRRWRQNDINLTEASNEAKDNVKYLSTLEKFIDPLYNGTPTTIIDTLPALLNSIKMVHTIARYYNTTERMTSLFMKITNQMIVNCKNAILAGQLTDDIWNQDPEHLLHSLESCLRLNEAFQEQYRVTKDKLLAMPKGRQFDFSETQIFGKFDLFCRRVIKLIDMFSTIFQFKSLARHNLEGMEPLTSQFFTIIEEFKNKKHDLLDFFNSKFDRDYVEFNVRISDLEILLQQFINTSFESISSIESSLNLLKKFQTVLQRDSLKADLDSKFTVIFHNYGLDLSTVQEIYEKHKHNPPISRNMTPVAGNILWARHLLKRIEEPMRKFETNPTVLATKDSKKIIKTYNKVARTLVAFEYLWYEAWCRSIESAKAGLLATLIIRHPKSGKLYVNFDPEILQLIREAKCLDRMGIEVPESAKIVLLQEEKFKSYFNELTYLLKEFSRVLKSIAPIARPLLAPHIADLELKLKPGMTALTWTSMNIDAYKHHVQVGIVQLEELVSNINDIIENRVDKNLKLVGRMMLVNLPSDSLLALDEYVHEQEEFVQKETKVLEAKNMEIENAVEDLVELVVQYQLHPSIPGPSEADIQRVVEYYNKLMYQGLLQATKNSLNAIKKRVCASGATGFLFVQHPFFEVDVQLSVPSVRLSPSLDDIQRAINKSAHAVVWCTKTVWDWGQQHLAANSEEKVSFFERIGQDVQIVRHILLLTGALHGTRSQVREYLGAFGKYDWLWKDDMELMYRRFMDRNPSIEDFKDELSKFVAIEEEIQGEAIVFNIGALSLNTRNLKLQLRSEASQWKVQYSDKVHQQACAAMEDLLEYIRQTTQKLSREVNSLESLRYVMTILREVRERESSIEMEITPILDMYEILDQYLPAGVIDKEEMDKKSIIRSSWRKLVDYAEEVTDNLAEIQGHFKTQLIRDVKEFTLDVSQFRSNYIANGPMVAGLAPAEAVERLKRYKDEYEVRARKLDVYAAGEELFALKKTEYPELAKTKKELQLLDLLYGLYIDVVDSISQYRNNLWSDCVKEIDAMSSKASEFEVRCKKLPKKLRDWDAYRDLRQDLNDFQDILPLLQDLSKHSMRTRHWQEITQLTDIKFNVETGKLKELWKPELLALKEDVEEICEGADKQLGIEAKLTAIKEKWAVESFSFSSWRQRNCPVLKGFGQIVEDLEESQLACQTMLSMRHVTPFKEEVSVLLASLSDTAETLERWIKVQMLWMSLESVFTGGDIAKQMPTEAKKFAKIDKDFVKIMQKASDTGYVVASCANELLKNTLPILYAELEKCQKSLEGYLEQKRNKFPRFYFVSNPVLLQILSQGSDVASVQAYYEKIFDSITKVVHAENDVSKILQIVNMIGSEEEVVPLCSPVSAQGNIEDWLGSLEKEMKTTMKQLCLDTALDCDALSLREFVDKYCGQFSLLGIQFNWTNDVNSTLAKCKQSKGAMSDTNKKQLSILTTLSSWCLQDLGTKMNRRKIETLVTIQVHQRDVFLELFKMFKDRKIQDANDFEWLKQARFSWRPDSKDELGTDGACVISICDVDFNYSHEYLGCKERLVITPLTDRCYITLSQALGMHLGGAPAGPAGTGKTETVKDLGRTLGLYVVVTNCTDQQRYTDMAKIFKGLCQAGLWGCFDEFNRIELPVLSVVAQQVLAITNAKRTQSATFAFPGDPQVISLSQNVGYFITMNPGYAGRQELPENLKALFRSVAMMVPDREMIMRVRLCSVGYTNFTELAKKFNTLYRCCEEQLSNQKHYDFGLRNILSVLRTAGQTKRDNVDKDEHMLVMRTLRDMNLSKFVAQDVPLFLSLLQDLFPSVGEPPRGEYPVVQNVMSQVIQKAQLVEHESWVRKVIQLYETALVRHGIMLVGPSGGGKTRILETLTDTLSMVEGVPHRQYRMNPKAIRAEEMFGETDKTSGEWVDGVFAAMWSKYNDRKRKDHPWIVCDGPVDAIWIENLNTVLDDNKILTLANGDRIPMTDNVKLMFEVENLTNASPATVSRVGIVFVSDVDLGWAPVLESWLRSRPEAQVPILRDLFKLFVGPTWVDLNEVASSKEETDDTSATPEVADFFLFARRELTSVMECSRVGLVTSFFRLLESILDGAKLSDSPSDMEAELEKVFVHCMCWTLGSLYEGPDRKILEKYLRSKATAVPNFANGETIFDYWVDPITMEWKKWQVPSWEYPREHLDFANLRVPTMDSTRTVYLLQHMHRLKAPILVTGGSGTAKTSTILMFCDSFNPTNMSLKKINFSSATSMWTFQETIEGELDKRGGRTFGPPGGRAMTVFLDDLSMPEVNPWGDQPTLEIVRQLIETGQMAFLDKDKRGDMKIIEQIQYIGAMNHPGGGKNDIPNRLKRQFFIYNMVAPENTSINDIYGRMLKGRFLATEAGWGPVTGGGDKGGNKKKATALVDTLTPMTISLWSKMKTSFLPTPTKFHYIFNMRELSRVFEGVLRPPVEFVKTEKMLVQLWRHEVDRVFSDKLVSIQDKDRFRKIADDVIDRHLGKGFAATLLQVVPGIKKGSPSVAEGVNFVNFMQEDQYDEDGALVCEAPQIYEPAGTLAKIEPRVQAFLASHNEENPARKMDLVLFGDALRHLLRISRIIGTARGNALLVGVGGSGKQSMTRLAAYIARHHFFQITLTKQYNISSLLDDFRELYIKTGKERKPVTFVFTEAELKDESFLEVFNSFLMTGEIAGLFPKDELNMMAAEVRHLIVKDRPGFVDTAENLVKCFIDSVRDYLHVVMCMSPLSAKFSERARRFPGIVSGATIDWFLPWPKEALTAVASGHLDDFELECEASTKEQLVQNMGRVHLVVTNVCTEYFEKMRRNVYQTPKSFLSFLQSYKQLYASKLAEIKTKEERIKLGLKKLATGAKDVEKMKLVLAEEEVKLRVAEQSCNDMLSSLEVSSLEAKKEAEQVAKIKSGCEEEAAIILKEKNDAKADLAAATPFLEEAEHAVNSIKPNDLNELKKLPKPGDIIKMTFDGVMILRMFRMERTKVKSVTLGIGKEKKTFDFIQDSYPICQKTMLSDSNFLKSLFHFSQVDKDNINDETIELLMPYIELSGFQPVVAKNASKACEGLCAWVHAMVKYQAASKVVKPKLEKLGIAVAKLEDAMEELAGAENKLKLCKDKLAELQDTFQTQMNEKAKVEASANATKLKMEQATALIDGLKDERVRWTADAETFADVKMRLVGDCALASAFVSYCGPFNQVFRDYIIQDNFTKELLERGIPLTKELELTKFLVDVATVGEWNLEGLPTDALSTQNGIMVTRSSRYPLLVDPQGQGLAWIRTREAENLPPFGITTLSHPKFRDQLEFCMSEGRALIVAGIEEELDPILDPVLEKQVVTRGKSKYICVSDKLCEVSDAFNMYMTTRLPTPHFSPELQAKTTIVDFAVTLKGLEDQLLGQVIKKEQRALEEQLADVMESVTKNTKALLVLNEQLLERLTANTGNLLDDVELISVLASTKRAATEVNNKLKVASETKLSINEKREQFRPVATRGSVLYFSIVDLCAVNCMYQTSLDQFMGLFLSSMDNAEKFTSTAKRTSAIIEHMTYSVYRYTNRGLYERDKLAFVLIVLMKILVTAGRMSQDQWTLFLRGGADLDLVTVPKKPFPWLSDAAYLNVVKLSQENTLFRSLVDDIRRNEAHWRRWYEDNEPETVPIPDYETQFIGDAGGFNKMLLVRCMREDRTILAVTEFIRYSQTVESMGSTLPALGARFAMPVTDTIDNIYEEMTLGTPVIYLLSAGADPTESIEVLCKKKKMTLTSVSLGEGQGPVALKAINTAVVNGSWVLLQNCHLGLEFMEEMPALLDRIEASDNCNTNFRLFITTDPHPKFPIALLQRCTKVTNEPPAGLKSGLLHSYTVIVDQERLERVETEQWRKLVFVLCFLHSIVQERRKFGPLGWNIPYEYNTSDIQASMFFLEKHLYNGPISWPTVQYMVSEVQYGGKITDDYDRILFNTYASLWIQPVVLAPNFTFNSDHPVARIPGDFVYSIPDGQEIDLYTSFINGFPEVDSPEVFGLHPNGDMTFRVKEVNQLLSTILETQPKAAVGGSGGQSAEAMVAAKVEELLRKVPKSQGTDVYEEKLNKIGGFSIPLNIFVFQELQRFDGVLHNVEKTLSELLQAIRGEVVMTPELAAAFEAIVVARAPGAWMYSVGGDELSWVNSTLGLWFSSLVDRSDQYTKWLDDDRPSSFWLSGFFNPQGFLTAVKQEVTRLHKVDGWALDSVMYHAEVTTIDSPENIRVLPKEGCYVHGLVLDGCGWSKEEGTLCEPEPKTLFATLPVLYITTITKVQRKAKASECGPYGGYECPVYKYLCRTDRSHIFSALLPSRNHRPTHWTLRGVALICSTDM